MDTNEAWERRVEALWARFDDDHPEEFPARMDVLVAELPES